MNQKRKKHFFLENKILEEHQQTKNFSNLIDEEVCFYALVLIYFMGDGTYMRGRQWNTHT